MAGKHRKKKNGVKKVAMMGAATATVSAMTLGLTPAPTANAAVTIDIPPVEIELPVGVYTTGLPFRILDLIGQGLTPDDLPIDVNLIEFLSALDPQAFYNAVNATPNEANIGVDNPLYPLPLPTRIILNGLVPGLGDLLSGETINLGVDLPVRAIVIASFGFASYTTMDTYRKLAESTRTGLPPGDGYTAVEPAPNPAPLVIPGLGSLDLPAIPNTTLLALLLIRDPGRPNGGIGARFAPLFSLFGIDTVTPDVMPVLPEDFNLLEPVVVLAQGDPLPGGGTCAELVCVTTTWQGGAALLPIHVNVGWEYDPVSDFPATANPFSIVNSLMAGVFPTYILREPEVDRLLAQVVSEVVLEDILNALGPEATEEDVADALNIYLTLGSGALPLLEPQRLLVDVINLFTGLGLGTPISDSIEPALKILTNIGYTDVLTPADIATGNYPGYEAWDRYLGDDEMATPTPFFSQTLTPEEYLQVPGAVIEALIAGFTETFGNGYQIFDPARRNALATLLNAVGVNLPSLDLGATLQQATPDLSGTFLTEDADEGADLLSASLVDEGSASRAPAEEQEQLDESEGEESELTTPAGVEAGDDEEAERPTFAPGRRLVRAVRDVADNLFRPHHRNDSEEEQEAEEPTEEESEEDAEESEDEAPAEQSESPADAA